MKRKSYKRKKNHRTKNKKRTVQSLTVRDYLDVFVVITLLIIIVYFSAFVRNNHYSIPAWPVIKNVNIKGNVNAVDLEALKAIIHSHTAGGFLRVQMDQLELALEKLTWVHQASVQRYWPDTLSVKILQHEPIARWGDTGLMNAYGDLFFPDDLEAYRSLPMLYGEEVRAKELASTFENSMQQLKSQGLRLRGLFEDERQSKHLVLSNGLVIALGDGDVYEKLNRFITAYRQFLTKNAHEIKKIDLRYTNGLAVEWKNPQIAHNMNTRINAVEPAL